jgi:hypothetical protein
MADIKKNSKELDDSSLKDASGGKGRMRPRKRTKKR